MVIRHGDLAPRSGDGGRGLDRRRVVELDNLERHVEDARTDDLQLDLGDKVHGRGVGELDGLEGEAQLSSDGGPFYRGEVAVLEDEHQGGGSEEGGVRAEELRLAHVGGPGGGWFGWGDVAGWEAELGGGGEGCYRGVVSC